MSSPTSTARLFPDIPGYDIIEQLYQGSRTVVYRAVQTARQQRVVIKLMRGEYPSFGELVQFRNQYTIAKNLDLPGIVQPLSLEVLGKGYALVMEDGEGIALSQYFQQQALNWVEILEIALQLSTILHNLHQQRVIHKDIKPANILICPESKQVKLIDFSIASLLPKETQEIQNPNLLEGTLAYLAPEQTGRMNRGIDYRADLYALGVTLYQLLSGQLPFESSDPMELVHSHIAKTAQPVDRVNPEVPGIVGAIVAKLMAKNAEDRYQSALGLQYDLQQCLTQWQATGTVADFELGERDLSDRFLIPEKLYGRETEVQVLLQSFDRVAQGASELMLVTGFSGIGKTVVVNEVHKPITQQKGYFIKGKFDQFNRNIPLSAFVQALRDLMEQLLSESDVKLAEWKTRILEAVGDNGQVLIEVIPELERVIGQQPSVPELSGTAAQNRFNLLFHKFVQVFTTVDHPLAIFLDDLQWSDSASLQLLKVLMESSGYLLVLGAYRDNEVSPAHPLMLTIGELKKANLTVNTIALSPLSLDHINCLVADTLKCSQKLAKPLTQLVDRKTQGNPFFTTQFLKALYEDGYIIFNCDRGYWQCDITQANALALTDDVVEFMALQLQKLPVEIQQVLKLAACIGNQFDLSTLAVVSEQSPTETATVLWKALQEGFILPITQIYKFFQLEDTARSDVQKSVNPIYRFLHDRVQQAAYSLIPDRQKQATHYQIGQLLLQQVSPEAREEKIFEIVNQLNYGISLISEQTERNELARLNLTTCRKARTATAYQAALEYAEVGLSLLGENAWQQQYEMSLAFHELAAEVAMLCGDFDAMEKSIDIVTEHAHSLLEQVNVYRIRIQGKTSQRQLDEVLTIGIKILQQLGANITESPTPADIQQSIQEISELIGDRQIADFVYLPVMADANKIAITQIASSIMGAAYTRGSLLYPLLATLSVKLFLRHGNISLSASSYTCYSVVLCNMQNIDLAAQFGNLALNVATKFDDKASKVEVFFLLGSYILHRKSHFKEMLPLLSESYTLGLEVGNLEYAGYAVNHFCWISFWCAQPLANVEEDTRTYSHALVQMKQLGTANYCLIYWQVTLNLLGVAEHPTILSGSAFQETEFLPRLQSANDICGLYVFYSYKLMLCFLFGEVELANQYAVECRNYFIAGAGTVAEPAFYLYDSLVAIALLSQPSSAGTTLLERVAENQNKLQYWADYAPMNHQHKVDLVEAEKCRFLGQKSTAIELYDKAILGAKENEYVQEEALANELAAKFYLAWNKEKIAQIYMQEAYYCYARWGAKAKVFDLEKRYPQLLAPILQQSRSVVSTNDTLFTLESLTSSSFTISSSTSISDTLDLKTILKASQAISGEIELSKLLSSLLSNIIENAGADKCVLMLLRDKRLLIKGAITQGTNPVVLQRIPIEESQEIPHKLIYKVKHNQQTVLLVDATADPTLVNDPYIVRQQPKSILCIPILYQGKLLGILYLENNVAKGAFTNDRVELINLLCAQAAISLENARLYERSQEYSQQLERSLSKLKIAQSRFHNLVDNVPGVVYQFLMATDGSVSMPYISNDCYDLYEITAEQAIADVQILLNTVHPEDAESQHQSIIDSIETLTPWRWEGRIITPSGKVKWIHGEARIEKLEDGTLSWDGLLVDISDRKATEAIIEQKSKDLENTLQELQNAQLQIVQNEKMASLGNLVAGIAHEINNPIGFLNGSIDNGREHVQDLLEHLALYQQHYPNPVTVIQDRAEDIDLEYICEDLPQLLKSMQGATDRIKSISTSLRIFSRADTESKVSANLHEGIDSTLLILKYRLKANERRPAIEVTTNYGEIPAIDCFPGQLNQVFMNILANAIDMFDEMAQGRSFKELEANPQQITIDTVVIDNQVQISIRDNGKGIDADVKSKIFDHLFTTKSVGKGTGLGLAIARQIVVDKHGGRLEVNSEPGQGAEFCIRLPIRGIDC